jgi:hypothetical protein
MDVRADLERLLAEQLDGVPDEARSRELSALLRQHPELQADYLDHMQVHALLQWRAGTAVSAQRRVARVNTRPQGASMLTGRSRRQLIAALFVTAASLAALFLLYAPQAQATPDLVDRLVELNVDLAQTAVPEERARIYEEKAAGLKVTLANAKLAPDDRELAESLLENSKWLTRNADPTAEADRFNDIADQFVTRIDAATAAKDEKRIIQLAGNYQRIAEAGIDSNLERAAAAGVGDVDKKNKLERTAIRHASLAKRLAEIVQRNPEPSRRAIHHAMKGHKTKK